MKAFLRVAAALVLAGYAALFVLSNPARAPVDLVFLELPDVPLWLTLGMALLLGGGVAALVMSIPLVRMGLRLRRLQRQLGALEQEVHGLRTLPLGGDGDEVRARPLARES